jgi:hypothetical protein
MTEKISFTGPGSFELRKNHAPNGLDYFGVVIGTYSVSPLLNRFISTHWPPHKESTESGQELHTYFPKGF